MRMYKNKNLGGKKMNEFRIEVENRFKKVNRELLVYNSLNNSYSIVRWPGENMEAQSTVFTITDGEHLLISPAPKHSKKKGACWVELPKYANLVLIKSEETEVRYEGSKYPEGKGRIVIEEGPHDWQLMVTAPLTDADTQDDTVRVGDNG
jgi:hypothetical protein